MQKQRTFKKKVDLMLDSGAFSAWNRGEEIKLSDYIDYLNDNKDLLSSYVSLDMLPPGDAVYKTSDEYELSATVSYSNQQKMKEAGLQPIPVFHQGEEWEWLERMLADGEPYIGISASSERTQTKDMYKWYDDCFCILTNSDGWPLVKVHGFGVTLMKALRRYPWCTVDSTTWSLTAGYGKIFIPKCDVDGRPDYLEPAFHAIVSGRMSEASTGSTRAGNQRRQFESLSKKEQKFIRSFLDEIMGLTIAEIRYGTNARRKVNLRYYLELQKSLPIDRFRYRKHSLRSILEEDDTDPIDKMPFKIMFATTLSREWSELMTEVGAWSRLLSYYEIRSSSRKALEGYVRNGQLKGGYERRIPKSNWESETYLNYRRLRLFSSLQEE